MNANGKHAVEVLLVEDSPADVSIVREALSRVPGFKFIITESNRLEDALLQLARQHFDVALLDLGLPDSEGLDTFVRFQAADESIPIIVLSGQVDGAIGVQAVQAGAQDYLVKGEGEERVLPRAIRYAIERKRSVEVLRQTHAQLRLLMDHSPVVHTSWKVEGTNLALQVVSENVTAFLGFTVAEVLAPGWWRAHVHPDDRDRALAGFAETLDHVSSNVEYRLQHKDGSYRWVDDHRHLVRNAAGLPVKQVGIWTDVTERNNKDEALHLRESALCQVSQGVLICDENRRVIYANPGFTAISGYRSDEILEHNCSFLQGAETDPATVLRIRAALNANEAFEGEILNYRKDGTPFWNELSINQLRSDKGGANRFIGIQRDITLRKEEEAQILFNEQRYRSLVEATAAVVWDTPASGKFEVPQPSWTAFTGQTFEQLQGWGWLDAVHPEDQPETSRVWSAAVATRKNYEVEHRLRSRDGSYRHMVVRAVPILWEDGTIRQWIGIHRDVTERVQAAEALAVNEELLRQFIQHTPAAIAMLDTQMRYIQTSERWIEDYHIDRDIIGKSHYEIFPDIPEHWKEIHQRVLGGAIERCEEDPFPRADGTTDWLQWELRPWRKTGGEIGGIILFTQVITERKGMDEALRIALERLQLAVKAGKAGTWDLDLRTGHVDWDEQMLLLYGKTAGTVAAGVARWFEAIHPDDQAKFETLQKEAALGGEDSFETEFRIRRGDDGSERFIRSMSSILRDGQGQPVRMMGINWDVTEERLREEKLVTALAQERELAAKARAGERAKSAFLAGMSHEIRTPMNAILGFANLIARSTELPADCREYINIVTNSSEALLRILNDVLDYSRLEANGLQIDRSSFSPCEILRDVYTLLAPVSAAKGLEFKLALGEKVPELIWNDAGRVRQVLLNLASNAVKFTDKGSVTLGVRLLPARLPAQADSVEYYICDSGPGIPAASLQDIFEPFQQLDSTISRRYGGSGLGLSISRNLVRLMGGTLDATSELGVGSEFRVSLPNTAPQAAPSVGTKEPLKDELNETYALTHPLRLLLVEDDPMNRKLMLVMLRKLGYEPIIAENGSEAVAAYQREPIDCILMDLQMPHKDGFEAASEIRELERAGSERRRVFIAACTANVAAEDQQRCYEGGMDAYLAKPVKWAQLTHLLLRAATFASHQSEIGTSRYDLD